MDYVKKMQEDMLEGELLKRQVDDGLKAEQDKQRKKREDLLKLQDEQRIANEEQLKQSEQQRQKELDEDRKIDEFAKKKSQMNNLRKDKEEQRFEAKQAERQRLIDRQIQNLVSSAASDQKMLNKQVEDAEIKAAQLFEEKERRRREMKDAIDKSRKAQMVRRKAEKEMEKQEENEFASYWRVRNEELQEMEQQEAEDEKARSKELLQFTQMQNEEKHKKAENDFYKEQKASTKAQALVDQQEKYFYSYAEKAMDEWQGSGKNVKPLVMELKGTAKALHKGI